MVWSLRGSTVCYLAAVTLLVLLMMRTPAAAQAVDCNGIDDCTAIIGSGRCAGKDLARLFSSRCSAYNLRKDYDRAISDCNAAIRLDSLSLRGFNNRAYAYLDKGDYDQAIADMSEAIKLAGLCNDQAIADVSQAIKRARGSNGSIEELRRHAGDQFYFWARARAYRGKGDYDHAIADYDRALLLASDNDFYAVLLSLRGEVSYMKGDNNRAIASYDESLQVKPNEARPLYGRGSAKLKRGDHTGGNADIAAAKAIQADIADQAARHGVKP